MFLLLASWCLLLPDVAAVATAGCFMLPAAAAASVAGAYHTPTFCCISLRFFVCECVPRACNSSMWHFFEVLGGFHSRAGCALLSTGPNLVRAKEWRTQRFGSGCQPQVATAARAIEPWGGLHASFPERIPEDIPASQLRRSFEQSFRSSCLNLFRMRFPEISCIDLCSRC